MIRRTVTSVLGVVALALALVAVPGTAHAAPAPAALSKGNHYWVTPYLVTAYGPLARQTEILSATTGCVGFYSPVTGGFNCSDPMKIADRGWKSGNIAEIDEKTKYYTIGYTAFHTAYGAAVWATQYRNGTSEGRWVIWNLVTNRAYAQSGWHKTA